MTVNDSMNVSCLLSLSLCVCVCVQDTVQQRACELVSNSDTFQQIETKINSNKGQVVNVSNYLGRSVIENARGEFGYAHTVPSAHMTRDIASKSTPTLFSALRDE